MRTQAVVISEESARQIVLALKERQHMARHYTRLDDYWCSQEAACQVALESVTAVWGDFA